MDQLPEDFVALRTLGFWRRRPSLPRPSAIGGKNSGTLGDRNAPQHSRAIERIKPFSVS